MLALFGLLVSFLLPAARAAPPPLDSWRTLHFTPAELLNPTVSADGADPDGDGRSNLLEYALGSYPRQPDAGDGRGPLHGFSATDGGLRLTLSYRRPLDAAVAYPPDAAPLAYVEEASGDLLAWSAAPAVPTVTPDAATGTETVTVADAVDLSLAAGRFLRLRVNRLLDTLDTDGDGLSDHDETTFFNTDPTRADSDADGLGNGRDRAPRDPYNPLPPTLLIAAGNNQSGAPDAVLPQALTVQVLRADGLPLSGAPVTFSAGVGLRLAASPAGPWTATRLQVAAGSDGRASVFARVPHTPLSPTASVVADALNREGVPAVAPVSFTVAVPFADDLDDNGLPDGWERRFFNGATGQDPFGDPDADGLANVEELDDGADPRNPDSDGDGKPDGEDSIATDPDFTHRRLPAPSGYAIVDLRGFNPVAMNNLGQMVGYQGQTPGVWSADQFYALPVPDHADEPAWAGVPITMQWVEPVSISDEGQILFNNRGDFGDDYHDEGFERVYAVRFVNGSFAARVPQSESHPQSHDYLYRGAGNLALGVHGRDVTWRSQGGPPDHYVNRLALWSAGGSGPGEQANLADANDRPVITLPLPPPWSESETFYNAAGYDDSVDYVLALNRRGQMAASTYEGCGATDTRDLELPQYGPGPLEHHLLVWSGAGAMPVSLASGDPLPEIRDLNDLGWLIGNGAGGDSAWLWLGDLGWKPKALPLAPVEGVDAAGVSVSRGNGRGQVLAYEPTRGLCLWQNGRLHPIEPLVARGNGWSQAAAWDVNDAGMLFGAARFMAPAGGGGGGGGTDAGSSAGEQAGEERSVLLLPVELKDVKKVVVP